MSERPASAVTATRTATSAKNTAALIRTLCKTLVQASPIAAPTTKKLRRPDLAGFIMRSNPIAFGFWPTERPGHPLDDPKGARSCLAAPGFPLAATTIGACPSRPQSGHLAEAERQAEVTRHQLWH
jgi:hypothetical protein